MSVVCRHFANGFCQMGDACGFLHQDSSGGMSAGMQGGMEPKRRRGMKTQLCRHFSAKGSCSMGAQCGFAHGDQELGSPQAGGQNQSLLQGDEMSHEDELLMQQLMMDPSGGQQQQQQGGKGQGKVFLKTKLCTSFEAGFCTRGEQCSFAHGQEDIGSPQPVKGQQNMARNIQSQNAGVVFGFTKSKLCQYFTQGMCTAAENCSFAHGEHELGTPQPPKAGGGPMGMNNGHQDGGPGVKTRICNHFSSGAHCRAGDFCMFAHGEHELGQPRPDAEMTQMAKMMSGGHPAPGGAPGGFRKTKLCVHFAAGFCTSDGNCSFAHGEEELGAAQTPGAMAPTQTMQQQNHGGGRVKTKICIHFQKQGTCAHGDGCGFAHGEHEIGTAQPPGGHPGGPIAGGQRQPRDNLGPMGGQAGMDGGDARSNAAKELFNFKTTLCTNFQTNGSCPRGDKCSFAHGQTELMAPGQAKAVVEAMDQQQGGMQQGGMQQGGMQQGGMQQGGMQQGGFDQGGMQQGGFQQGGMQQGGMQQGGMGGDMGGNNMGGGFSGGMGAGFSGGL